MEYNDKIIHEINEYCMRKPLAYESRPFGEHPICYRVMGKIFAQFIPIEKFYRITLKCTPDKAQLYRQFYPGVVVRGHHCPPVQQSYWNTINLDEFNDMDMLYQMIDEAYEAVVDGFSRKAITQLKALSELEFISTDKKAFDFSLLCDRINIVQNGSVVLDSSQYEVLKNVTIQDVIIAYHESKPVACGALTIYDAERAELKYIYTEPDYNNIGLDAEIVRRLEAKAKINGYNWCLMKVDKSIDNVSSPNDTYGLYKRAGYKIAADYVQGTDIADSIYMERKI